MTDLTRIAHEVAVESGMAHESLSALTSVIQEGIERALSARVSPDREALARDLETSAQFLRADLNLHSIAADLDKAAAFLRAPAEVEARATPSSRWRENGWPDPHGDRYSCERAKLAGGDMTDDEVANAVFLSPDIANLTVAKDRIRWLSRRLASPSPAVGEWRPIASAPLNELVILTNGTYVDCGRVGYLFSNTSAGRPTYWQPLPPAPPQETKP